MLSRFQKFIDGTGRMETVKESVPAAVRAEPAVAIGGGKGGYMPREEYKAILGEFNQKFGAPPYLVGLWRATVFTCTQRPAISMAMVETVLERAGGLKKIFPKEAQAQLAEIQAKFRDLNAKLEQCHWSNTRALFLKQSADDSLKAGGQINLGAMASESQINEQIAAARSGLHKNIQDLCAETFLILEPIAIRARDAAREICIEMDSAERANAAKFGAQFVPSKQLCAFAYLAVVKIMAPLDNYTIGSGWLPPDTSLEAGWRSGTEDAAQSKPIEPRRELTWTPAQGYQEKSAQRIAEEKRWITTTAEDHAYKERQLIEINKFNDSIRQQPQK